LVVEGYMDVVALAQHGFNNAVATLGTACTAEHVLKLFRFTESVIFSFDGDAAGRRAAGRALEAALPHATDVRSVKFLFLPTEHDPDSYVRDLGADAFEACIAEAIPLSRQLMEVAGEGCDLSSAEGRARILATARPLWQTLPQGLLKRQLLGDLARRAQLPDQELMGLWQVGGPAHQEQTHADGREHPPEETQSAHAGESRAPKKKEWKKDWKPGTSWKRRGEPEDETIGTPRSAPNVPADHALRMLLLNSAWWERLSPDDHQLLHELPGIHGELIDWLDRYLLNHGNSAWSVLEAALTEAGLIERAKRLLGGLHSEDESEFEGLQTLLKKLRIVQLEAETTRIAASNPQGEDFERYKRLLAQIKALKLLSISPSP